MASLLDGDQLARVIFAAIALGGSTLTKYLKVTVDLDKKKKEGVERLLAELLNSELGFDEAYSSCLTRNLHRLNSASVKLLECLDPGFYHYIKISTVVTFDYST